MQPLPILFFLFGAGGGGGGAWHWIQYLTKVLSELYRVTG